MTFGEHSSKHSGDTCDQLELRLYDEDCRLALVNRRAAPLDVTSHLASCERCRASWAAAANEIEALRRELVEPLPADLRTLLYSIPLRAKTGVWMARLRRAANAVAAGAVITIVAALVFSTTPLGQIATFALVVLAVSAFDHARSVGLDLEARRLLLVARSMTMCLGLRRIM